MLMTIVQIEAPELEQTSRYVFSVFAKIAFSGLKKTLILDSTWKLGQHGLLKKEDTRIKNREPGK